MAANLPGSGGTALKTFTIAEGILLLVLGLLALSFPVLASFWVTAIVAVAFLVWGLLGWVNNLLRARHLSRAVTFWRLVVSTLFVLTGAWMILQFRQSGDAAQQVALLALAIGVMFLVEGLVACGVSLSHRDVPGWGWGLANGIVTIILGLLIVTMKFWGLLWVVGMLVGISLIFSGIDLIGFGARFHPEDDGRTL
ncbi:MAG: DUF308 domain-containing protein [Prochlorococcaceae cyanobacterium]